VHATIRISMYNSLKYENNGKNNTTYKTGYHNAILNMKTHTSMNGTYINAGLW
jgi:hypothetical protein